MIGLKPWIVMMAKEMVLHVSNGAAAPVGEDADGSVLLNFLFDLANRGGIMVRDRDMWQLCSLH